FVFFSGRIRHTWFARDWSSDVCASDLGCGWLARAWLVFAASLAAAYNAGFPAVNRRQAMARSKSSNRWLEEHVNDPFVKQAQQRSEERRGGKACWRAGATTHQTPKICG